MDLSKLPKLSGRGGESEPAAGSMMTAADLAQFAADSAPPVTVQPVPVAVMVSTSPAVGPAAPLPVAAAVAPLPQVAQPTNPYSLGQIGFIETWMSVGIGTFILLLMPRFMQWVSWKLFNTNFDQFEIQETHEIVPYTKTPEFWSDLGPTLLGVVLIVDGILFLTKRKAAVAFAMAITLVSTIYNLWFVIRSEKGDGVSAPSLPVYSAVAVLFGGMMLATQWMAYRSFPRKKLVPAV